MAQGEVRDDAFEQMLAALPGISVPTVTLEGDANGAPHPGPAAYATKCSGEYVHRQVTGGIGHNLPQEAPRAFARCRAGSGELRVRVKWQGVRSGRQKTGGCVAIVVVLETRRVTRKRSFSLVEYFRNSKFS